MLEKTLCPLIKKITFDDIECSIKIWNILKLDSVLHSQKMFENAFDIKEMHWQEKCFDLETYEQVISNMQ